MLHCLHTPEKVSGKARELTVLEKQRARLNWHQQPVQSYLNDTQFNVFSIPTQGTQAEQLQALVLQEQANLSMTANPGLVENGWPDFGKCPILRTGFPEVTTGLMSSGSGFASSCSLEMDYSLSRTSSCPPAVAAAGVASDVVVVAEEKSKESVLTEKMGSAVGRESFKKRKQDKAQNSKVVITEEPREKRIKGDAEDMESKVTEQNNYRETSADTSKENSKTSEIQKLDYIHVRARRGQATDSHSLAERVRREKISEKMKYLQDLVPGCNKITGKAGMLDEIISYVQSLQRQVEFLSMKLATVNPRLDFAIDNFFAKEIFPACTNSFPMIGISSDMANPAYLQCNNPVQPIVSCCGSDLAINPPTMGLRRSTSARVSIPDTFLDTSCFAQAQLPSSTWETDLQNIYNAEFHQGRSMPFPYQTFTGNMESNNLKMEM